MCFVATITWAGTPPPPDAAPHANIPTHKQTYHYTLYSDTDVVVSFVTQANRETAVFVTVGEPNVSIPSEVIADLSCPVTVPLFMKAVRGKFAFFISFDGIRDGRRIRYYLDFEDKKFKGLRKQTENGD